MNGGPETSEDRDRIRLWTHDRDPRAFADLVSRHGPGLRRVAVVVLGLAARRDPGLAEEALQEALRRLMSAFGAYRGRAEPFAFMAAVVRKSCLDVLRRERRARGRVERAAALDPPGRAALDDADPIETAERSLRADSVMKALDSLGEPERSLVYLRDAEGASVAELSRAFGIPDGTVKSKLARARARLRATLAKEGIVV